MRVILFDLPVSHGYTLQMSEREQRSDCTRTYSIHETLRHGVIQPTPGCEIFNYYYDTISFLRVTQLMSPMSSLKNCLFWHQAQKETKDSGVSLCVEKMTAWFHCTERQWYGKGPHEISSSCHWCSSNNGCHRQIVFTYIHHFKGISVALCKRRRNSSTLVMELRLLCIKKSHRYRICDPNSLTQRLFDLHAAGAST